MSISRIEREIGGRKLVIESGKIAKQAAGSVLVTYGDTVVLTAVVTAGPRPGIDFFPLTVDYREKIYAAGKFPGGFFKREARPTTKEVLTMRMIDRPARPLFPKGFKDEILIQSMVISTDQQNDPDVLAMVGASAALSIAPVPYDGPTGAVRVGHLNGEFIINPTEAQREYIDLEAIITGHRDGVNMIEVGAGEVGEEVVAGAVERGHQVCLEIYEMIEELKRQCGQPHTWTPAAPTDDLKKRLQERAGTEIRRCREIPGKLDRKTALKELYGQVIEELCPPGEESPEYDAGTVRDCLDEIEGEIVTDMVLSTSKRSDGRGPDDIRPISCEVAVLPRVHGSALFTRGETQTLVATTLGTSRDEQVVDGLIEEYSKKFMLHYNFPPFCVGEVKRIGPVSRREIGHGALAERSLESVLPSPEKFPYTIRLVSDILESNGSSSMASVCGGTLALMDAGVSISQPVAGISIGMFHDDTRRQLVVDITGEEDHFGDMDFKVAGTQRGVTGVQLDLKTRSLSYDIIRQTLAVAKEARIKILREMLNTLSKPRSDTSIYAPRIITLHINPEKIGRVIGPGGKGIRGLEAKTGAKIDIDDDGTITISSTNLEGAKAARDMIEAVAEEVKLNKIYTGRVASIKDFGAFIEIIPGQDGLCHISELSDGFVQNVSDVCKVGDVVEVKVIAIDGQGRVKLSRKAALKELGKSEAKGSPAAAS